MDEFNKIEKDAIGSLNRIIDQLEYERDYYECDITMEYSPFEEDVKLFCDNFISAYLANDEKKKAFDLLVRLVNVMAKNECEMYEEDIFRPTELLTYYFAKIISLSNGSLKNRIHNWMYSFTKENEESLIANDYFRVFLEGKLIYHADKYYTNYADYKKVLSYYKP